MTGEHRFEYKPAADLGLGEAERLRSARREPGLVSFAAHRVTSLGLRTYLRVYHGMRVSGTEYLPVKPPFVMVANHASHLDALVLAASLPASSRSCAFPVAAGDVFFESLATSAFASMLFNALPLWRKRVTRHALDELRMRLVDGCSGFILFPEGARSRDGLPLPYKPGIGRLVASTGVPVIPCYLEGPFEALPPDRKVPRPVRISVRAGPALRFDDVPNTREGWELVAERIRESVLGLRPVAAG